MSLIVNKTYQLLHENIFYEVIPGKAHFEIVYLPIGTVLLYTGPAPGLLYVAEEMKNTTPDPFGFSTSDGRKLLDVGIVTLPKDEIYCEV